jgi:acetyl-CoA carboxylase biotin carboxyl carrier protein
MDGKELQELRELVELLKVNGVGEFDMERDDLKVHLKFQGAEPSLDLKQLTKLLAAAGGQQLAAPVPLAVAPTPVAAAPAASAAPAAAPSAADPDAGLHVVKSPIVGTFYDAPSPGAPTFVKVGDKVEVGAVLCIVEAMKLMNEIESDVAGEVVAVKGKPGQPVEYGQPLFTIKAS